MAQREPDIYLSRSDALASSAYIAKRVSAHVQNQNRRSVDQRERQRRLLRHPA
jgi:hypothetical protein